MSIPILFLLWTLTAGEQSDIEETQRAEKFLFGEEVVTIAARREQPLSEAPSAVTVITRNDILSSGALSIVDLLRRVPGVNVAWINPSFPLVSLRGFNQKALVLVDGREVTDQFFGLTFWDFLSLNPEDIERIEVIRGPGSALYGVNAYAGVINILTRSSEGKDSRYISGAGGYASMQGVPDRLQVPVQDRLPTISTIGGGWSGVFPNGRWNGSVFYRERKDWYDFSFNAAEVAGTRGSASVAMGPAGTMDFEEGVSFGQDYPYHPDVGDLATKIFLNYSKANYRWKGLTLQGYWNHYEYTVSLARDILYRAFLPTIQAVFNVFDGEALYSYSWRNISITTAGGNWRYSRYSMQVLPHQSMAEKRGGAYLQEEIRPVQNLSLTLGARYDVNTITVDALSPRAALVYSPFQGHSFRVSWGKAFRKQNLIDLTTPTFDSGRIVFTFPAWKIQNMEVTSYECGYGYNGSKDIRVAWDAFYLMHRNSEAIPWMERRYPKEGVDFYSYGLETTMEVSPAEWLMTSLVVSAAEHFEITDFSQAPPDKRGKKIDRAPALLAHWTIQAAPQHLHWGPGTPFVGLSFHYTEQYVGSFRNPEKSKLLTEESTDIIYQDVGPYLLADVTASYRWKGYEGGVVGKNIFDNIHREFPGVGDTTIAGAVPGKTNYAGELVPREIIVYVTARF